MPQHPPQIHPAATAERQDGRVIESPSSTEPEAELAVDIVRSPRRRKTVQGRLVDGRLRISVPAGASPAQEAEWVDTIKQKFARKQASRSVDLAARARRLARKHDLPAPAEIVWSDRQQARWGSCSIDSGRVRLSNRLAAYPDWVIDYVIVHELAHLVVAGHNDEFYALVDRYPLAERARGYLIARGEMGD